MRAGKTKIDGCIFKDGSYHLRIRVKGQKKFQRSLHTADPKVAGAEAKRLKAEYLAIVHHGVVTATFDDALVGWESNMEAAVRSGTISAATMKRYMVSLDQLRPFLKGRLLKDITRKLLVEIVATRESGVTHQTITRDLNALSSVLGYAVGKDWIEFNPVRAFFESKRDHKLIRPKAQEIVIPRSQDYELVKRHGDQPMFGLMMEAARLSGARLSDLIKAEQSHIDHKRKQITFHRGKRNKTRTLDLDVLGGYELFSTLPRRLGCKWLFWHDDGKPYTNFSSHFGRRVKAVARMAKRQGLDFQPFTFHSLRHLHAVEFLKARAGTIQELSYRLGHSSVATTEMYLRSGLLSQDEVMAATFGEGRRTA